MVQRNIFALLIKNRVKIMYELTDLSGLILELIQTELAKSSNAKFNMLKDEVEQEITRHTNYTAELIADEKYADVKSQLRRPFAWILEYYTLAMINNITDLQKERIFKNYKQALDMLATYPRYYETDEGTDDSSSTFDMECVSW